MYTVVQPLVLLLSGLCTPSLIYTKQLLPGFNTGHGHIASQQSTGTTGKRMHGRQIRGGGHDGVCHPQIILFRGKEGS